MDAIVAVYSDWGIGADGTQPVVLKADRKHFVELTRGRTVIVGRRTLADFPGGRHCHESTGKQRMPICESLPGEKENM